jgi:hypothetical protein
LAAPKLGSDPILGVGALKTLESLAVGAKEDAVAMLDTELLLVGLPGRAGTKELGDAGKAAGGCFTGAVAVIEADILDVVGVGVGVEWFDDCDAVVLIEGVGWCRAWLALASGPVYFSPNSPGLNVKEEQNPSEELISSVEPSFDLSTLVIHRTTNGLQSYHVRSVKVA